MKKTDSLRRYLDILEDRMERILNEQRALMGKAAALVAAQVKLERLVYVFGSGGHSNMTYMEYGDALVDVEGIPTRIGAYSTFGNAFICNCVMIRACEMLVEEGVEPPVIRSINTEGGLEANQRLYAKYRPRIKWL